MPRSDAFQAIPLLCKPDAEPGLTPYREQTASALKMAYGYTNPVQKHERAMVDDAATALPDTGQYSSGIPAPRPARSDARLEHIRRYDPP